MTFSVSPKILSPSLVILVAAAIFFSPLFRITTILCQVDINPCPQELLVYLAQFNHRNLFIFNTHTLIRQLQGLHPEYKQVLVNIELPHTLRIEVTSRSPIAILVTSSSSTPILVDSQGVLIGSASASVNLPLIFLATPSADLLLSSVNLLQLLQQSFISFVSLASTQSAILDVKLKTGMLTRFSLLQDLNSQVNSLQLILQQATIVPLPRIIDVRFDKPVLIY